MNLALFEGLDDVAGLEVLVAGQSDTALEAGRHFTRVVLEATQRRDRAFPDDRPLAKEANLRATGDDTVAHEAAGDRTDARHAEDFAHLGLAGDDLFEDRREQTEHGGLD